MEPYKTSFIHSLKVFKIRTQLICPSVNYDFKIFKETQLKKTKQIPPFNLK